MSKSLYEIFSTDSSLEKEGIAVEYGEATIILARAGGSNRKFQSVLERKMRPYRSAINSGTMDESTAERLLAEAYAEAVIRAWDGVTFPPDHEQAGQPMPFSADNVVKVLLDLPDLFRDIQEQSTRLANFITEGASEDVKS